MKHLYSISWLFWIINLLFFGSLKAADSLAFSSNPSPLTISSATAGNQPNSNSTSTTYSVSTANLTAKRITARLSNNLPANIQLAVNLQAPSGATSQGTVVLSTTNQNIVTNIVSVAVISGLNCTYTLSATVQAAPVANSSYTITWTLLQ